MPLGKRRDYAKYLEYAIVEETIKLSDAKLTLNKFALRDEETLRMIKECEENDEPVKIYINPIHDMICTGKVVESEIFDPLTPISAPGLLSSFNKS